MRKRNIDITIGQIQDHIAIKELLALMTSNDRGTLYDSIKDYMSYRLTNSYVDFNPAIVDFLMTKTKINPQDASRVCDVVGMFIRITRSILDLARFHVRGAVGASIVTFRASHINDYRRDTLTVMAVYE